MQAVILVSGSNDEVEKFTYQGNFVSATGGTDQDVEIRLVIAWSSVSAMESKHQKKNESKYIQLRCESSFTLRIQVLDSNTKSHMQDTRIHRQMFRKSCDCTLARHNQQP